MGRDQLGDDSQHQKRSETHCAGAAKVLANMWQAKREGARANDEDEERGRRELTGRDSLVRIRTNYTALWHFLTMPVSSRMRPEIDLESPGDVCHGSMAI
jgi:hypothetical protein